MGVTGAAIASAISYGLCGLSMFLVTRKTPALKFSGEDLLPRRKQPRFDSDSSEARSSILREFARIGLPALGTSMASCLGYVFFAGMVSGMGTTIFAAHSLAVTAEQLFYIPGYGLRTATTSLVGNALGENDIRKMHLTERFSIALTVTMMVVSGICLYFISEPLMRLFTPSEPAALLGAQMLRLVSFTEPFFGLMIVLEGISYGKGRTKGVFIVETFSMWAIRILFTFLLRFLCHLVTGAWIWGEWMPEEFMKLPMTNVWVYSFLYNGWYMLFEIVITEIVAMLLYGPLGKYFRREDIA